MRIQGYNPPNTRKILNKRLNLPVFVTYMDEEIIAVVLLLTKKQNCEASFLTLFQSQSETKGLSAEFMQIYRSREVGQSYVTSVWTTLVAMAHALWLMIKIRPQVVLCNGPGTCIPQCVIAFFFKVVGIRWSSIFYVESIARVKRLFTWFVALQVKDCRSVLCAMAATAEKIHSGALCRLPDLGLNIESSYLFLKPASKELSLVSYDSALRRMKKDYFWDCISCFAENDNLI
ncbi:hypothetical protein J1N35_018318 [Gossypium stocksii]|uniref:UDP-N-acetylglucosamine transferase subunit ALG14 n=1 Tax=Gossypium stocksii TaxID=47602 RepID=A0A9D4A735_9ROSI|nr:hypothetical protein J1N35_018318 [Gossypium stocksii]